MNGLARPSLLWPDNIESFSDIGAAAKNVSFTTDLDLSGIARAMDLDRYHLVSEDKLAALLTDNVDIINYRLEIAEELLEHSGLVMELKSLLPLLDDLSAMNKKKEAEQVPLLKTVRRLSELDAFIKCINDIKSAFEKNSPTLRSKGLKKLYDFVSEISLNEELQALEKKMPELRAGFERLASVTIGINLDAQLRPVESVLLSINDTRFKGEPFIDSIFSRKKPRDEYTGVSKLRSISEAIIATDHQELVVKAKRDGFFQDRDVINSKELTIALFSDLQSILGNTAKRINVPLSKYTEINTGLLSGLGDEIAFYLGMLKLINTITSCGMPMCRPETAAMDERVCLLKGFYNIGLALRMSYSDPQSKIDNKIVTNDAIFNEDSRIFILTGPNRGGKTTYTVAIGLVQVLFQLGMFVPAKYARMSPVDRIFTHFPIEEKPESNLGRLGEESKRFYKIFNSATRHSLVLLNESLSSTSPGESLYICKEIVYSLKVLGVRAVFATHFHDLAENLDLINSKMPGDSRVVSMVSEIVQNTFSSEEHPEEAKRTYRIIPGPPKGVSYARDIAAKYGVSFEKLVKMMENRGVIAEIEDINLCIKGIDSP